MATAGSMTWALVALLQPVSNFFQKLFRLQDHDIPIPYLSFSRPLASLPRSLNITPINNHITLNNQKSPVPGSYAHWL
ncbi:hypothetical protein C8R42DRAFT_75150 [Lentinula raphanica]|nr:hypothetical protein C8R42DRAFT_75150 [Lentinula raphanica]